MKKLLFILLSVISINLYAQEPIQLNDGYVAGDTLVCSGATNIYTDDSGQAPLESFNKRHWMVTGEAEFVDYPGVNDIYFDRYDPDGLEVNVSCDPSSGYVYLFHEKTNGTAVAISYLEIKTLELKDDAFFNPSPNPLIYNYSTNWQTKSISCTHEEVELGDEEYLWTSLFPLNNPVDETSVSYNLSPLDEGWIKLKISNKCGDSVSYVRNIERILETPEIVQGSNTICDTDWHLFQYTSETSTNFFIEVLSGPIEISLVGQGIGHSSAQNHIGFFDVRITDQSSLGTGQMRCRAYNNVVQEYSEWIISNISYGFLPDIIIQGPTAVACGDTPWYTTTPTLGYPIDWDLNCGPARIIDDNGVALRLEILDEGTIEIEALIDGRCNDPSDTHIINATCFQPLLYPNPTDLKLPLICLSSTLEYLTLKKNMKYRLLDLGVKPTNWISIS